MWRALAVVVAVLSGAAAACSSVAGSGDRDADAGPAVDSAICEGALSEVGRLCPASFDGTMEGFPACGPEPWVLKTWRCQDLQGLQDLQALIVLSFGGGYTAVECYYDGTSHGLVGAVLHSDINEFCTRTSFSIAAGRVAPAACVNPGTGPQLRCPNGGG